MEAVRGIVAGRGVEAPQPEPPVETSTKLLARVQGAIEGAREDLEGVALRQKTIAERIDRLSGTESS